MTDSSASPPSRGRTIGPYIAVAILGFAVVVASQQSDRGPRTGRRASLIDLIAAEDARSRSLRRDAEDLRAQLVILEAAVAGGPGGAALAELQHDLDALGPLAGAHAVVGPGIEVVLRDSSLRRAPSGDPNDLVIHEQDIQAIVNALWGSGAEAMSINGERITSASAVRCVGNTLLLHGSVYAPPYTIQAIGDRGRLASGLAHDPLARRFAALALELRLGFKVRTLSRLSLPASRVGI